MSETAESTVHAVGVFSPKIARALVAAQKQARAVAKDSKNAFHNYQYASGEAIIAEARDALSSADLGIVPIGWHVVPAVLAEGQRPGQAARIVVTHRVFHAEGDYFDAVTSTAAIPERGRPEDKAEAGALTVNLAYFLRGLLCLPRQGADEAVDERDDREFDPKGKARAPGRRQAPEPTKPPTNTDAVPAPVVYTGADDQKRVIAERVRAQWPEVPREALKAIGEACRGKPMASLVNGTLTALVNAARPAAKPPETATTPATPAPLPGAPSVEIAI